MYDDPLPPDDSRELFRDPTREPDPNLRDRLPYGPDPLSDQLDAVERSIEGHGAGGDGLLDPIGRILDRVEAATEGTVIGPDASDRGNEPAEPALPLPLEPTGSFASKPPVRETPVERPWGELAPARPAVPFFTKRGWHRPGIPRRFGRSAGRTVRGEPDTKRVCPATGEVVDEVEDCPQCEQFKDWAGDGRKKCYYDWLDGKASIDAEQEG